MMEEKVINAVKGFNKDMTCTPEFGVKFQYKEGGSYEKEDAILCREGFHAVVGIPINAFHYYSPGNGVYHKVEMSGNIDRSKSDEAFLEPDQICATKIKIGEEISVREIIEESVKFNNKKYDVTSYKPNECAYASESEAKAVVLNRHSAAISSGGCGIAISVDVESNSVITHDGGIAASIGESSNSIVPSFGVAVATGNGGNAISTGCHSKTASLGDAGGAFSSGSFSEITVSGKCGIAASPGYRNCVTANHPSSCAVAWGPRSVARGVIGSHLVLTEWKLKDPSKYEKDISGAEFVSNLHEYDFCGSKTVCVDGENIKENTWYKLENGEVVECRETEVWWAR